MASNNLITPWIAAHVEHCLGFYIGQSPGSDIELTDDGTSLIFRTGQSSFSALVAEVGDFSTLSNLQYSRLIF